MAKAVLLVPENSTIEFVNQVKDRYKLEILYMKVVTGTDADKAAKEALKAGADIIISRGMPALIIAKAVKLPVIEISFTGQDVALLIDEARAKIKKADPKIALIIYPGMFRRSDSLGRLLGVELSIYMLDEYESMTAAVEQACLDGADIIVGESDICDCAASLNVPFMNTFADREGIENALQKAELLSHSIDLEKRNTAENIAYLNGIFHGIIEVSKNGEIRRINDYAKNLLSCQDKRILGRPVLDSFPLLEKSTLDRVLAEGEQVLSQIINFKDRDIVTNIEPIVLDKEIIGAVITVQEGKRIHEIAEELRKELYTNGFIATLHFDNLICKNAGYKDLIAQAKKAASNSAPVLICGEEGTEILGFAQCIHNASARSGSGFVEVECDAWSPEYLDEMLFGVKHRLSGEYYARSLIDMAEDGTIFLNNVDALSVELQYKVCKLIRGTLCLNGENRQLPTNIRVIAGTQRDLKRSVKEGRIRSDLFYTLNVQVLEIPPLRERKEDIEGWTNYYLDYYCGLYLKPVHLIRGGYEYMREYPWPGNQRQLDNFCHRIVLLTPRRNIDEAFIRTQLEDIVPLVKNERVTSSIAAVKDAESLLIIESLRRNKGSRGLTAKELGISTTTLWRKMQKYGITRG